MKNKPMTLEKVAPVVESKKKDKEEAQVAVEDELEVTEHAAPTTPVAGQKESESQSNHNISNSTNDEREDADTAQNNVAKVEAKVAQGDGWETISKKRKPKNKPQPQSYR